MNRLLLVVLVAMTAVSKGNSEVTFAIDLDPDTPGIQAERTIGLNQPLDAFLVLSVTEEVAITGYSTTVRFDASNFSISSVESPLLLPAGWSGFGTPVIQSQVDVQDTRFPGKIGEITLLAAGLLGDGMPLGEGFSATVAKITLVANSLTNGESLSLIPVFDEGIDGIVSDPVIPAQRISFQGATITAVPEPGSVAGLAALVIGGALVHRRRLRGRQAMRTPRNC